MFINEINYNLNLFINEIPNYELFVYFISFYIILSSKFFFDDKISHTKTYEPHAPLQANVF
jgi:hypothetical protein